MSSEIFYDKAFIRVDDRFIPVVNHGAQLGDHSLCLHASLLDSILRRKWL